MGGGDFKFLAMLGAWMGWQALPMIILLSAFVAAAVGLTIMLIKRQDMDLKIPYGPYLAAAGWICFIFELTYQDYLRWATP
jgi:leader peptidase (prepilin peptidase)/N-methyltransferase